MLVASKTALDLHVPGSPKQQALLRRVSLAYLHISTLLWEDIGDITSGQHTSLGLSIVQ